MQRTMGQDTEKTAELASALADGELRGSEFAQAVDTVLGSEEGRLRWHTYHLLGDVLRTGAAAPLGSPDDAFLERLRARLQHADRRAAMVAAPETLNPAPSANDSVWRWKLAAGLSSVVAMALLGWQLAAPGLDRSGPAAAQLAAERAVPSMVLADASGSEASDASGEADVPVLIRDAQLDQFIAAHQQLGSASALQMPAGFLRNATFQRPAR